MKICSLITLFNPDIEKLKSNISNLLLYCDKIYLLNNSKGKTGIEEDSKIEIINNKKNIGLSAAFNIGLNKAKKDGFHDAILFDQDSFLDINEFNILYNEYLSISEKHNVMCIGPSLNIYGTVIETPRWTKNNKIKSYKNIDSVKNIITSGMILNIGNALKIGGFNEDFPVDFCDFFFCWKALYNKYGVFKSKDAFIIHEIGNSQMKIGKHTIHFHAPYRNYFLVRDTLNICFKEKETPLSIRLRYLFFLIPRMMLFLLKCDRKKERKQMYRIGFTDFIHKKRGYGSIANILGAE